MRSDRSTGCGGHIESELALDLPIGDVETVAEKLVAEIDATKPVYICFSFEVGSTPHKAAMRSMELMIREVKWRVGKVLGGG